MSAIFRRPLAADAVAGLASIGEVCEVLRGWGCAGLAERLAYLASDADLEEGDAPATLESARGFLAFFGAVESEEGEVDLGTSWNGEICADWRFPDKRIVVLWFADPERVRYAARKSDGYFIDRNKGEAYVNSQGLARRLVDMEEWFTWFKGSSVEVKSRRRIT